MRHTHYKPGPVKHPEINDIVESLRQFISKMESIIDAKGKAHEEFKDHQDKDNFSEKMKIVTKAWCESYLDIEQVLVHLLAFDGITVDPSQENDTEISFHLRVLQMFDDPQNPFKELLGHRDGGLPITGFAWSNTWKEALDEETAKGGRNMARDSIDCLRMFKEWWPTSENLTMPAPEFLGSQIAPPENYEKWFDCILVALVAAMEVCARQVLTTIKRDIYSVIRLRSPETLRLRQEVAKLKRDLHNAIGERDVARADASRYLKQRDDTVKLYKASQAEPDDGIMHAVEDAEEKVWTQVRRGLLSHELYECIRGIR